MARNYSMAVKDIGVDLEARARQELLEVLAMSSIKIEHKYRKAVGADASAMLADARVVLAECREYAANIPEGMNDTDAGLVRWDVTRASRLVWANLPAMANMLDTLAEQFKAGIITAAVAAVEVDGIQEGDIPGFTAGRTVMEWESFNLPEGVIAHNAEGEEITGHNVERTYDAERNPKEITRMIIRLLKGQKAFA